MIVLKQNIEMLLQSLFAIAGHDDDLADTCSGQFVHHMLDCGARSKRQQFLGHSVRQRVKSRTFAGSRDNCAHRFHATAPYFTKLRAVCGIESIFAGQPAETCLRHTRLSYCHIGVMRAWSRRPESNR